MLERAFFPRSPRLYMRTQQATAQYGQVLRVSVARASLNSRTSASAAVGENPSSTRLEPAREALVTLRNSRRVISAMANPLACLQTSGVYTPAGRGDKAATALSRGTHASLFLLRLGLPRNAAKARPATSVAGVLFRSPLARWQTGHAAACNAVYAGSIPTL